MSNKYYYNDKEVIALYRGDNLIYQKVDDGGSGNGNILAGCVVPGQNVNFNTGTETIKLTLDEEGYFRVECPEITSLFWPFSLGTGQIYEITQFPTDTSAVTNMRMFFSSAVRLTSVNISTINTDNVTDMHSAFSNCKVLTELDLSSFNTSKVTNFHSMFQNCEKLKKIKFGVFDMSSATDIDYMWDNCSALETLEGDMVITQELNFKQSSNLSKESLDVIVNGLVDVGEHRWLTIEKYSYQRLTNQQLAIASSKGWSIYEYDQMS